LQYKKGKFSEEERSALKQALGEFKMVCLGKGKVGRMELTRGE
jgi:hypothetical protein